MSGRLIIIRGNSGSGKSTIATRLRAEMGDGTMLISQDVIRREIIGVRDEPDNPAIDLIRDIALFGERRGNDVIIEGILAKDKYRAMLQELMMTFNNSFTFYLDVNFEETLKRHQTRSTKDEFGENEMREWWIENDYLGVDGEIILPETLSEDEAVEYITQKLLSIER